MSESTVDDMSMPLKRLRTDILISEPQFESPVEIENGIDDDDDDDENEDRPVAIAPTPVVDDLYLETVYSASKFKSKFTNECSGE